MRRRVQNCKNRDVKGKNMKVLMVTMGMDIGGAETHILSLAEALSKRGHRVTVAAERGELCDELKKRRIRFIRMPLGGSDVNHTKQ